MVDKGVEETDGMLWGHVVVEPLWTQDLFVAIHAVEKAHTGTTPQKSKEVSRGS